MQEARVFLDWNAGAPLRPEARAAMLGALDLVGNPSSVHAEGRAARAALERARVQVARLAGASPEDVIFTSGATEAANMVAHAGWDLALLSPFEHDAVARALSPEAWAEVGAAVVVGPEGTAEGSSLAGPAPDAPARVLVAVTGGDGETGRTGLWPELPRRMAALVPGAAVETLADVTQSLGKLAAPPADHLIVSAHKLGGPKGVGALISRAAAPLLRGGGQERRLRSGTENLPGIVGFGAAAEAALAEREAGVWSEAAQLRNILERRLSEAAPDLISLCAAGPRLPNTSAFAVPGWKGETQVMLMDLAGFAVSAGSACASGRVGPSRVLSALGLDERAARSALRVSIGPTTAAAEVHAFADAWIDRYRRFAAKRPTQTRVPVGA